MDFGDLASFASLFSVAGSVSRWRQSCDFGKAQKRRRGTKRAHAKFYIFCSIWHASNSIGSFLCARHSSRDSRLAATFCESFSFGAPPASRFQLPRRHPPIALRGGKVKIAFLTTIPTLQTINHQQSALAKVIFIPTLVFLSFNNNGTQRKERRSL